MKIHIVFPIKNLRILKGIFQTLSKFILEEKKIGRITLIYFTKHKNLRFLIQSENFQCILALDPKIAQSDSSQVKQNCEMLVFDLLKPQQFVKTFCQLIDIENTTEVTLSLSREKIIGTEQGGTARILNLIAANEKFRNQIDKPTYDPPRIMEHNWLNGCSLEDQKKIQFDFQIQQLLNLLRVIFRHKETQNKQKMVYIFFNFKEKKVKCSLDKLKHTTQGDILQYNARHPDFQGSYVYGIHSEHIGKIYELLTSKSSGRRFVINNSNNLIFHYFHIGVFESQSLIQQWISFIRFDAGFITSRNETKLEN